MHLVRGMRPHQRCPGGHPETISSSSARVQASRDQQGGRSSVGGAFDDLLRAIGWSARGIHTTSARAAAADAIPALEIAAARHTAPPAQTSIRPSWDPGPSPLRRSARRAIGGVHGTVHRRSRDRAANAQTYGVPRLRRCAREPQRHVMNDRLAQVLIDSRVTVAAARLR